MKKLLTLIVATVIALPLFSQQFKFAYLSDTHITEGAASIDDLQACIDDINRNNELSFVIITGDITEFGADSEIELAKSILDKLNKPYYIIAGNHDEKWSESGCNTFVKVFGYEEFEFDFQGIKFIGTNSGPNMRMAPALLPRESMVWLDSITNTIDRKQPVVFINHYPMDSSMLNYTSVLDELKKVNTQLIMGGHWHTNRAMVYEGIPGVIGRSTMEKGRPGAGYNIVTFNGSTVTFSERIVSGKPYTITPWHTLRMSRGLAFDSSISYPRPDFSVNDEYANVQEIWRYEDVSDIGAGAVMTGKGDNAKVIYANTKGIVRALSAADGEAIWEFATDGKVYSTPAVSGNSVVVGSSDNHVYCLDLNTGRLKWKFKCEKSVLGSPAIYGGKVYIGASDNKFRAISLKSGRLVWSYDDIKGFIEARPYVDREQVVIGDWAGRLYSFNPSNGRLQWCWTNNKGRMLSPAAVFPVKANGRIFIATPERVSYAIDAESGREIWRADGGRESVGLSSDKSTYYVKTMKDSVFAFSTSGSEPRRIWAANAEFGYEIAPTPITVAAGEGTYGSDLVFVPTDKGNIVALDGSDGSIVWKHKLSYALINYIQPLEGRKILVSTMDGIVALLKY